MTAVVDTTMNYYLDASKGGKETGTFGTVGVLRRKFDNQHIRVKDLRGRENEFDIHTHAFQVDKWEPTTTSLEEDDIKQIIYPEAEEFIKKMLVTTAAQCLHTMY
jgi:hypothetical protein